jgi:hypothetical protein
MSYGWFAESGISVSRARSSSVTSSCAVAAYTGGSSRLFGGRYDSSAFT